LILSFVCFDFNVQIKTIDKKIGYPDYFDEKNLTQLEKLYAQYNFHEIHAKNLLILLELKSRERFVNLHETPTYKQWIRVSPTTNNAFYSVSFNQISKLKSIDCFSISVFQLFQPLFFNHQDFIPMHQSKQIFI